MIEKLRKILHKVLSLIAAKPVEYQIKYNRLNGEYIVECNLKSLGTILPIEFKTYKEASSYIDQQKGNINVY